MNMQVQYASLDSYSDDETSREPSISTIPHINGRRICTGLMVNSAGIAASVGLFVLGSQEYLSDHPNRQLRYAYPLIGGVLLRSWIEANLFLFKLNPNPHLVEKINNFLTRFSLEIYEILWNLGLNLSYDSAQLVLDNTRASFIGYTFAGEIPTLFKLPKINYSESLPIEERPIQNRRLGLNVKNIKGQLCSATLKTLVGVSCIAIPYLTSVPSIELFLKSLGGFLSTEGIGYLTADRFLMIWRKYEKQLKEQRVAMLQGELESPRLPWKIRIFRTVVKSAQRLGAETICILPIFLKNTNYPWVAFIALGSLHGSLRRGKEEEFDTLTQADRDLRRAQRLTRQGDIRPAVRVNQLTTCAFTGLFTGFCIYGLVTTGQKEEVEVSFLMTGYYAGLVIGRLVNHLFKPGTHGRLFNEACYRILYSSYFFLILYQAILQLTAINDEALDEDTELNWGFGLADLALLGWTLGTNQIKDYSDYSFSPPLFRAEGIKDILHGLMPAGS